MAQYDIQLRQGYKSLITFSRKWRWEENKCCKIETAEIKILIGDKNVPDQTKLTTMSKILIQI